MKIGNAVMGVAFLGLTGCHILFPEDPREGAELSAECPTRVASLQIAGVVMVDRGMHRILGAVMWAAVPLSLQERQPIIDRALEVTIVQGRYYLGVSDFRSSDDWLVEISKSRR